MRGSRQTVQSAEVGGEVLKALARLEPSATLTQIGEYLQMPVAKVHRYLQALIASGLSAQDTVTGRYLLGPEALHIGLAALDGIDVVTTASQHLPGLCEAIQHSCFLAIWGNRGPTVVRAAAVAGAVTVVTRIGTVMPLLGSATGLMFAAFIDNLEAAGVSAQDMAKMRSELRGCSPIVADRLARIRKQGEATVQGLYVPGIDSIAVPVFGPGQRVVAVLTALGPHDGFDAGAKSPIRARLSETARAVATQLGSSTATSTNQGLA